MKTEDAAGARAANTISWGMIGHEWAVQLLVGQIARGNLRHAYLFSGPAGVGRRTLALRFAQAINCPTPLEAGVPCQTCHTCTQIAQSRHPDLSIVQAERRGGTLRVDQIREVQRSLSLSPYTAAYRIALLLRFEEAHPSAANALLKTLEEPPARVVLLLTAESPESLLPTVVSRCEVLRLRPVPTEKLRQSLVDLWNVPEEEAGLLASIATGRPGYAHHLRDNPQSLRQRQAWLDDLDRLLQSNRTTRFVYAESLAKDKEQFFNLIQVWESFWRDVLLRAAGMENLPTNLDRQTEIASLASQLQFSVAKRVLTSLGTARNRLEHNANTRLTAENLLLNLPFIR